MCSVLTMETPFLHYTCETLSLAVGACIDELADKEPVGSDLFADGQQARMVPDAKFPLMSLGTHALGGEVAQHGLGDASVVFPSTADAYSIVSMLLLCFMTDNLVAIELEDGAGYSFPRLDIVDRGHALFGGQRSRS